MKVKERDRRVTKVSGSLHLCYFRLDSQLIFWQQQERNTTWVRVKACWTSGSGEMAQKAEDPGSVPSTHMVAHSHRGSDALFWHGSVYTAEHSHIK